MLSVACGWRSALAALLLAAAAAAQAAPAARPLPEWSGRVTYVSDGDSLWIQPAAAGTKAVEIRLADIDAPELCQAWGPQAREALKDQVAGKTVSVRVVGHDGYGRTLARVTLDGQNVAASLVQEGHAFANRSRWNRGPLVEQEQRARSLNRGLHARPDMVAPKDFRRRHGPCPRQAPGASGAR